MSAINNVSDTAFWVATYRAKETDRPDALFRDPLARKLAGERGRLIASEMPGSKLVEWNVVMRTVVIDDYITRAIADGADLILNLGTGLDTRAYRMNLPDTLRWVEVDFPPLIEFKEHQLAGETPRCQLERVKLDLTNRAERREFLASVNQSARKILVLTEGVVPYLSVDDTAALADDLKANGNIFAWIVDYFAPQVMQYRRRSRRLRKSLENAPFQFDPPNWTEFFLAHGWQVGEMRYLADEGVRQQRTMPLPLIVRMVMAIRKRFVSPAERNKPMRFVGYARMERT